MPYVDTILSVELKVKGEGLVKTSGGGGGGGGGVA